MDFSEKAQDVIDTIYHSNSNIFVTGKAGTGKSSLLDHIRLHAKKKIIVLAPTGISAINVNGETIHSFFTLKPGFELDEAKKMKIDEKKQKKFSSVKTIAIDEISMVRADLIDAIDIVLRRARKNDEPFGGVQMIFFGDLYQLPPVITKADKDQFYALYESPYFFDAEVFKTVSQSNFFSDTQMSTVELTEIYRQKGKKFIDVLNAVREGQVSDTHISLLNSRFIPDFEPKDTDNYVHLVTTNAMAAKINETKLNELPDRKVTFKAKKEGTIARNLYPNDEEITLCVGAQVMFIRNDSERRWVNGTIGTVLGIKKGVITVEKNDGSIVKVEKEKWEISQYVFNKGEFERDVIGSYTQIPLKLAWAMTIHKSQGKTFDKVVIDFGRGTFVHGQTYVALSRCTTLKGMVLKKKFSQSSIIMDDRVKEFKQL